MMTETNDQPLPPILEEAPLENELSECESPVKHTRAKWGTKNTTLKLKKFDCECGGKYFQQNIKYHQKSKRHMHFLETGEKWCKEVKAPKPKKVKVTLTDASNMYRAKREEEGLPMRVKADLSSMSDEERIVYRREQKRAWAAKRRAEINELRAQKLSEIQHQGCLTRQDQMPT